MGSPSALGAGPTATDKAGPLVAVVLMGDDRVGELVEAGPAKQVLRAPSDPRTMDYVSGIVG